ncbi:MAG: glycosyltransferase [Candidatus Dormibacteria bacterium]
MRLGDILVRDGVIPPDDLELSLAQQGREGAPLGDIMVAEGRADQATVWGALAQQWGQKLLRLDGHWIDPGLGARLPVDVAHRLQAVPIRATRKQAVVAMADPRDAVAVEELERILELKVVARMAAPDAIRRAQERGHRAELLFESTSGLATRNPEASAERTLTHDQKVAAIVIGVLALVGLVLLRTAFFIVLSGLVIALYAGVVVFRGFITYRGARHGHTEPVTPEEMAALGQVPVYTILCPLYREAGVMNQLVSAISALDYPKSRLDVKLLLEADDTETLEAVRKFQLPPYFHLLVVPAEGQRTKPKACNYGLQLARGEYVVIFDAEDIPEPDQLKKALCVFRRSGLKVGCVQAKLGYYNRLQNILTGWFSLEYAAWFDFFLPGLQELGLPIPLGGSSNHLPTHVVRGIGAWDPSNVTEDADLGMRLLRSGYTTVVLDSTTLEEANSDFVNWVRQRSRWGKGYAVSWLVQMRHPRQLLHDVGLVSFLAIQLTLGGTYAVALLNLLMWTLTLLWILAQFGFIGYLFPSVIYYAAMIELLFGNFFFLYLNVWCAVHRSDWRLARLALASPIYWLLISIAMIKATIQLVKQPTFWEKTVHGLYLPPPATAVPEAKA